MTKHRQLFEILMEHIGLADNEAIRELQQAEIQSVDLFPKQHQWKFTLAQPERFHPNVYQIILHHLRIAFEAVGQVELWCEFAEEDKDSEQIMAYWYAIISVLATDYPYLRSAFNQASYQLEGDNLIIGLASDYEVEKVQVKYRDLLQTKLQQVDLKKLQLSFVVDLEIQKQTMELAATRQQMEHEQFLQESWEQEQQKAQLPLEEEAPHLGKEPPKGNVIAMQDLVENQRKAVIEGYIFKDEIRDLPNNAQLLTFMVTDYTNSVTVKLFAGRGVSKETLQLYRKGLWIRMEGDYIIDTYTNSFYLRPKSIRPIAHSIRLDQAAEGERRVELHSHTQMSQLDATNSAYEIIERAAKWGHSAVAITDHVSAQAFPEAFQAAKDFGIKVIYGIEAYVVNDGTPIAYNLTDRALDEQTSYVVFDVETTGLSSVYDNIIELAAVKMQNGLVIDSFEAFVNPGHPLSQFTIELTGITDAMLADAPSLTKVMGDFQVFCQDSILVAHNASFDIGFIDRAYKKVGLPPSNLPVIDTLELSRLVNPDLKGHRLNNLAKKYGVELQQHHRAVYDSETTGYILYYLLKQAKEQFQISRHSELNSQLGHSESYKLGRPFHASLLVKSQPGLKALFKLISLASIDYFYREARIPRSVLNQYREHLLIGTACAQGEVFTAMMQKGYEEAAELIDYYDYVEIQPPSAYRQLIDEGLVRNEADLQDILQEMIRLAEEKQKPLVVTGNVHYLDAKDAIYRDIIKTSLNKNSGQVVHNSPLHFRTTDEMLAEFAFLGEAKAKEIVVTNTQALAEQIDEIEVIKKDLYTPKIAGSEDEIKRMSYQKAYEMYGNPLPEIVQKRIEKELDSIISNGFSVIYLISQKLVQKSNDDGYLVGSRGSVGSSLIATLTGITEVNPLVPHYYCPTCQYSEFFTKGEIKSGYDLADKACPSCGSSLMKDGQDIPFETFLGFYGDKVPDIDLNFSGEYQAKAHAYTKDLFGEDYVYRAGTIGTVANKSAHGYVFNYIETSGQEVSQAERERLADGIEGVKRTTGQHPGGIIVIPSDMDVYDFTPIQFPAENKNSEWRTTHFDFHSIDNNVLKLDILGHDDPTMIRMLQDLSGIDPQTIPAVDAKVMEIFSGTEVLGVTPEEIYSETGTLGVPEFGTGFVRGMVAETKPKTFAELLQISGLSHGTDVYLGNAQELIRNKVVPLSEVIGCRDDIMTTLMLYGLQDNLAFKIMEHVRKGKGIPEEWQAEMRNCNVPEWYIDSCLKIKYMFPKAHAAAYVLMALRVAYFKVYYPLYYYATYFTIRAKDYDLLAMHQGKAVVKQRLNEIKEKGQANTTNKEKELEVVLELANEMLERGFRFQMVDLAKSDSKQFIIEDDSLIPPFRAIPGLGDQVAENIIKAREEAPFISKEDLQKRGKVSKTIMTYLEEQGVLKGLPDEDQLSLF